MTVLDARRSIWLDRHAPVLARDFWSTSSNA